jgi:flagellar L-ring protein precursor FlgH
MRTRNELTGLTFLAFGVVMAISVSGCAKLFGGLRQDMDDQQSSQPQQYTSGGQWPEHGWLDDNMPEGGDPRYNAVGHSERGPASANTAPTMGADGTWVSQSDQTAAQRDTMRGVDGSNPPSFSNSPNMAPPVQRQYKNGSRATSADFVDDSQSEGSLWASDGQTNYYFTKNKVHTVGDIITVKMENPFIQDVGSEIKRTLSSAERDSELQAAQNRMNASAAGAAGGAPGAQPQGGPAPASVGTPNGVTAASATDKDIDVTKSIDTKDGDPIMAEIVARYPNGNYKIQGTKKIMYKNGTPRLVTLLGVARGADIGEDDTIPSGKLYEYRIEAFR